MESSQEDEIRKLSRAMLDPAFRESIQSELDETLQRHGVNKNLIPEEVFETLTTLSPEELATLAKVRDALTKAKVSDHVKAQWV